MVNFNPMRHKYTSVRNVIYAKNGMVASTQPLASSIGIEAIKKGGNAIDAAVAIASTLPLMEPTGNGLGCDTFALVWTNGKLYGLNGSGNSAKALNGELIKKLGYTKIPSEGWLPVMVPGAPAAWAELNRRFGTMSLKELMAPAAKYAREGFPVAPNVIPQWTSEFERIGKAYKDNPELFGPWMESFTIDGRVPHAGEIFSLPAYADTLDDLARTNCKSYYHGSIMKKIIDFSNKTGGYLTEADFESYKPEWVEPITINYKGYDVYEMPPNGHGITALMALNILKKFELGTEREVEDVYHKQIEAIKLAFADTMKYVSDPRTMYVKVADMLSDKYADIRRQLIGQTALMPEAGNPSSGDTVYFATADGQGNMVSFIQSNFVRFGSGVVIPNTGISLQDRGIGFSLDPKSSNYYEGGKKAYHTIIPGFLAKGGMPVGPFGVMGGFMQPQGHVQVVVNTVDFDMSPQEALDAPRFQWVGEKKVQLEREVPTHIATGLDLKGHQIEIVNTNIGMGRGEIIWRMNDGTLCGGTESRADGCIVAF